MSASQGLQTVQGYISALPKHEGNEENAVVSINDESTGIEYYVIPRGMGVDLAEHVNVGASVTGIVQEKSEIHYIQVRNYKLTDEYGDEWYDDKD